jgi:hypothetical protein
MSMARVNFSSHERLARDKDHRGFGCAIWVSPGCETKFAGSLKKIIICPNMQGLITLFFLPDPQTNNYFAVCINIRGLLEECPSLRLKKCFKWLQQGYLREHVSNEPSSAFSFQIAQSDATFKGIKGSDMHMQ